MAIFLAIVLILGAAERCDRWRRRGYEPGITGAAVVFLALAGIALLNVPANVDGGDSFLWPNENSLIKNVLLTAAAAGALSLSMAIRGSQPRWRRIGLVVGTGAAVVASIGSFLAAGRLPDMPDYDFAEQYAHTPAIAASNLIALFAVTIGCGAIAVTGFSRMDRSAAGIGLGFLATGAAVLFTYAVSRAVYLVLAATGAVEPYGGVFAFNTHLSQLAVPLMVVGLLYARVMKVVSAQRDWNKFKDLYRVLVVEPERGQRSWLSPLARWDEVIEIRAISALDSLSLITAVGASTGGSAAAGGRESGAHDRVEGMTLPARHRFQVPAGTTTARAWMAQLAETELNAVFAAEIAAARAERRS